MSRKIILNKRKINQLIKIVYILLILFSVVFVILLAFQTGIVSKVKNTFFGKPIVIEGECYVLFDNIFYQISDENDCRNECTNECWVRDEEFSKSEFVPTPRACNLCNCYCK